MATKISEYSSNPASNTDLDGINLSENVMVPSDVNDALRMQMAHLKDMDTGTSALTSPELTSATISGGTIDNTVIGDTTAATGSFTNVTVSGTVDGRDVAADGTKLDGIEASADVTDATNVAASGALMTAGGTMSGDINFGNNDKAIFGAGSALQIYHNGANSYIDDTGAGNLYIRASDTVRLQSATGEQGVIVTTDGAVTLYHDNGAKLATTASGINVTGTVVSDGLDVDGVTKIGVASAPTWDTNSFLWTKAGVGLNVESYRVKVNTGSSRIERMRVDANGDISFYDNTGVTQGFYWDASTQRLGLGTTTPSTKLHISTGLSNGILLEDNSTSNAAPNLTIIGKRSDGNGSQSFSGKLRLAKNQTNAAIDGALDKLGTVMFGGNHTDSSQSNILYAASISGISEGAFNSSTDMPTGLAFYTGSTGRDGDTASVSSGTERLRIDSSGNVGIGTNSPSSVLHLSTSNDPKITLTDTGFGASADITGSNGNLRLNSTTATIFDMADSEVARIDSSGNIGIGTTATTGAKLKVDGGATAGTIIQAGNAQGGVILGAESSTAYVNTTSATPLAFEINNSEKMRINSNGDVGIGRTDPENIVGTHGGGLVIRSGASRAATTSLFAVQDSSGNNSFLQLHNGQTSFSTGAVGSKAERARITAGGDFLIGTPNIGIGNLGWSLRKGNTSFVTTDATPCLTMKRGSNTGTAIEFVGPNSNSVLGNISVSTTAVSFNTTSDYRLKENVTAITSATDRLKQLNPVRFNFIVDPDTTVDGFLAHEAQAVVPEAVTGTHNEVDDDGDAVMQGIDQSKLVPLLTAALQEALTKIDQLETRITALEA